MAQREDEPEDEPTGRSMSLQPERPQHPTAVGEESGTSSVQLQRTGRSVATPNVQVSRSGSAEEVRQLRRNSISLPVGWQRSGSAAHLQQDSQDDILEPATPCTLGETGPAMLQVQKSRSLGNIPQVHAPLFELPSPSFARPLTTTSKQSLPSQDCHSRQSSKTSSKLRTNGGTATSALTPMTVQSRRSLGSNEDDEEHVVQRSSLYTGFLHVESTRMFDQEPLRRTCSKAIDGWAARIVIGLATVLSFVGMIVDTDCRAAGEPEPDWLRIMEYVLLSIFFMELVARLYVERASSMLNVCTIADVLVVVTGVVDLALVMCGIETELAKARVLRVMRLTKLVRVVYRVPLFFELRKLVYMMGSCFKTLFWSFLVLGVVMTSWSILAVELVHPRVIELADAGEWGDCGRCRRSFSSVFHANITFFQTIVAGDSWGKMAIPVIEAHPWTAFIFCGALLTLVFGVLNVIVAVVVDAFAEARARDVFTRAREMEWEEKEEKKALADIFGKIDRDGSGTVDLEELKRGAKRVENFSHWLRVLDIDERDLEEMFLMLDQDGSGDVHVEEFVECMYRMKNSEAKTATQFVRQKVWQLDQKVVELDYQVQQWHNSQVEVHNSQVECVNSQVENVYVNLGKMSDLLEQNVQNLNAGASFQRQISDQISKDMQTLHKELNDSLTESLRGSISPDEVLKQARAVLEEFRSMDGYCDNNSNRIARRLGSKSMCCTEQEYISTCAKTLSGAATQDLSPASVSVEMGSYLPFDDSQKKSVFAALTPEASIPQALAPGPFLLPGTCGGRCHRSVTTPGAESIASEDSAGSWQPVPSLPPSEEECRLVQL